ncbi:hypothetical protein QTP88_012276 [Uroleucon formosanum]
MPKPTAGHWLGIANRFYQSTHFPNCLGAIDGKHIRCRNPINAGSYYFNYKKFFSIVLMAVVDANLSFICIDVGAYRRESDSTVFKQCTFGKKLYAQQLNIPKPTCFPNTESSLLPYVFLADEAFGLHTNLLKPYPGRDLNDKRDGASYADMESNLLVDDLENRGAPASAHEIEVRDAYADYFMGPGKGVGDGKESDWFSIFLKSSEFLKTPPSEILPWQPQSTKIKL